MTDVTKSQQEFQPEKKRFETGDVFAGRYRMITRIGRGGMGDVWRADDLVLETPVALKLIDSSSPATRARILNEVRLARQITHRSVCRVFDVGETDGDVFFSMEFVRGEDLATLLGRVRDRTARTAEGAAHGLHREPGSELRAGPRTAVRRVSYLLAFVRGDSAEMARQFDLAAAVPESNAFAWQARTSVFAGRLDAAHEQFRRAIETARGRGLDESAAQLIGEDAEARALAGQCGEVRQQVSSALDLSRDIFTLQRGGRTLALCGAATEALSLSDELKRRFPDATLTEQVLVPVTAAILALDRGELEDARQLLEPMRPYDRTQTAELWPSYLRGLVWLRQKQGGKATVEFQYVVDNRGVRPTTPLFALAHLGLARAAAMSGDLAKARKSYEAFLAVWGDADSSLQPLKAAREEYGRLQ